MVATRPQRPADVVRRHNRRTRQSGGVVRVHTRSDESTRPPRVLRRAPPCGDNAPKVLSESPISARATTASHRNATRITQRPRARQSTRASRRHVMAPVRQRPARDADGWDARREESKRGRNCHQILTLRSQRDMRDPAPQSGRRPGVTRWTGSDRRPGARRQAAAPSQLGLCVVRNRIETPLDPCQLAKRTCSHAIPVKIASKTYSLGSRDAHVLRRVSNFAAIASKSTKPTMLLAETAATASTRLRCSGTSTREYMASMAGRRAAP